MLHAPSTSEFPGELSDIHKAKPGPIAYQSRTAVRKYVLHPPLFLSTPGLGI